ncbi:hypothetical protein [Streptomyces sp. NPDC051994]
MASWETDRAHKRFPDGASEALDQGLVLLASEALDPAPRSFRARSSPNG